MSRAQVLRRRAVAGVAVAILLVGGYLLWLRDSSLFEVTEVVVTGVSANEAEVTAALEQAGREMTTLHVRDEELADAVERFPTVASISADTSLFHRLEVTVTERLPVAEARIQGELLPVSADGFVLVGLPAEESLPRIEAGAKGAVLDPKGAAQAAILGEAPGALRDRLRSASWDGSRGGVVVELSGAPEVRFGEGDAGEDKWDALAVVLAAGVGAAEYVDVSVPERPVCAPAELC